MEKPAEIKGPIVLSPYRILLYSPEPSHWSDLNEEIRNAGFYFDVCEIVFDLPSILEATDYHVLLLDCTHSEFGISQLPEALPASKAHLDIWTIIDPVDAPACMPFIQDGRISAFVLAQTALLELKVYLDRRYSIFFKSKTSAYFAHLQSSLVKNPDEPHLKEQIAKILSSADFNYSGVVFHRLNYLEGKVEIFTGYANGEEIPDLYGNPAYSRGIENKFFHNLFSLEPNPDQTFDPVILPDCSIDFGYPFRDLIERFGWKSLIALPLYIKHDIHAVMLVFTTYEHAFDSVHGISERKMLQEYANLAATDHYNWRQFQKFEEIESSASKLALFVSSRTKAINKIADDLLRISEAQSASICYFEALKQNFDPSQQQTMGQIAKSVLDWGEISRENPGELAQLWKSLFFVLINKRQALRVLVPNFSPESIDVLEVEDLDQDEVEVIRPILRKLCQKLFNDTKARSMIIRCLRGRDKEPVGVIVFFYTYHHAYANPKSDHEYKKSLGVFLDLAAVTLDRAKSSKRKETEDEFFQNFIQETSPSTLVLEATQKTWQMTLEHLMEITGATRAILGFKDDWGINEFSHVAPGSKPFTENYLNDLLQNPGSSLESMAFEDNFPISIRSVADYQAWDVATDEGIESKLIIPILKQDEQKPIGIFALSCEKPNVFDKPDKEFVQKLAALLGIEIKKENVDTSGRVSIPAQTRFLVEATSKFAQIKPIRDKLTKIIDRFRLESDFDLINFHIFDPEWQRFDWDILSGNEVEDVLVLNQTVQEWLMTPLSNGKKIKQLDVYDQYVWLTGFFVEKESLTDSFVVKIVNGKRPIGILMFHTREPKSITKIEENELLDFAERVSKVVRERDILPELVEHLCSTLSLDNVSLHLYRARDAKLATPIRSGTDISREFLEDRPYAAVYRAMNHETDFEFVPDTSKSPVFRGDFVKSQGFGSAGFVKLKDQDEVLGVLFVNRYEGYRWHPREQEIIQIFAQIAAVALQNRRRLLDVKQSNKETQAVMKASRRMMQMGFRYDDVAGIVLRQAVQISGAAFATIRHVSGNRLEKAEVWGLSQKEEDRWRKKHGGLEIAPSREGNKYMVCCFLQDCLEDRVLTNKYVSKLKKERIYLKTCQKEVDSALVLALRDPISRDPIAILNLEHQEQDGFRAKTIEILEELVQQAATALHTYKRITQAQNLEMITWRGLFSSNWWHTVAQKTLAMETSLFILNRKLSNMNLAPDVMAHLEKFGETLQKIKNLPVHSLLPMSIEQEAKPIPVFNHLKDIVSNLVKDRKDVQVSFSIDDDIKLAAIHEQMLALALEKVVTNAMQAMNNKGQIEISDRSNSSRLVFDIRDNGPGIPDNQRDKFLVEWIDPKDGATGSGIGAMMAKFVFERYGGKLYLKQSDSSGTILTAELPLIQQEGQRISA